MHTIMGAIIAGGASRRFGSDKAHATWQGRALIDHAAATLAPQVAELVVAGPRAGGWPAIADRPRGAGPLGGLAAAIHAAAERNHAGVLCVPVDVHPLPADLVARLVGPDPAVFADQHLIGWWPAELAGALDGFVAGGGRALHEWIALSGARRVQDAPGLVNVNTPSDLARLAR